MDRKKRLISEDLSKLLIKQIAHELRNFTLYKSYEIYFGYLQIHDIEEYWHKRADEEMIHHNWIHEYLKEADILFMYPSVEDNNEMKPSDSISPFEFSVEREILTTEMIYKIREQAEKENDYMTMNWLDDSLIKEQREEENTSRAALDIMKSNADLFNKADQILDLLEDN